MDSTDTMIDPQAEVKKLQDLVKKLELQNEVLRNKQKLPLDNSLQNGDVPTDKVSIHNNNISHNDLERTQRKCRSSSGESEDDIIDVDILSLREEEDTWLYSSPKPPTPQQTRVSPYKWVRQEFDHPSPELETAKRSLLFKLNEVAKMNRSSSTPTLGNYTSPTKHQTMLSRSTEGTASTGSRQPQARHSLLSTFAGSRVDTGTFTRPKKSREKIQPGNFEKENDPRDDCQRNANVADIETLAKMQEESLRQSINASPRKGLRARQLPGQFGTSDTDNSGSPGGSNRSSPGRFDSDGMYHQRHRNSLGSDASSPPDSPHASQYINPGGNPFNTESPSGRRSVPNVSRLQYPQPGLHSSDSSLDHQSVGSDENNLAPEARNMSRMQQPALRSASPAIGGLKQPAQIPRRATSPSRSGLPTPTRRTIPRPATSRTSLPTPRRSNASSPRPPSSQDSDESWREGCF
ncbi:SLAIN motif-containing protein 2-like isoform X1 [Haliotis asinina]|uniref:SLAIN motif-containing protein 2-like isoform X1 n=1 Tax=Haliotis asinina TaxID=109174 RepID=UPI00353232F3